MIAKVKGTIEFIRDSYVVVSVQGVGYKIFTTNYTLGSVAGQSIAEFFTHTYVREDALSLYGFLTIEELEMFELLISISGIGPKAALGILSISDTKAITAAVLNEDPSILTRVSGVGKKTAQRVILELKNKVKNLSDGEREHASIDTDTLDALMAMGYSAVQARESLKHIPAEVTDVAQRVKFALKALGKNG